MKEFQDSFISSTVTTVLSLMIETHKSLLCTDLRPLDIYFITSGADLEVNYYRYNAGILSPCPGQG